MVHPRSGWTGGPPLSERGVRSGERGVVGRGTSNVPRCPKMSHDLGMGHATGIAGTSHWSVFGTARPNSPYGGFPFLMRPNATDFAFWSSMTRFTAQPAILTEVGTCDMD